MCVLNNYFQSKSILNNDATVHRNAFLCLTICRLQKNVWLGGACLMRWLSSYHLFTYVEMHVLFYNTNTLKMVYMKSLLRIISLKRSYVGAAIN